MKRESGTYVAVVLAADRVRGAGRTTADSNDGKRRTALPKEGVDVLDGDTDAVEESGTSSGALLQSVEQSVITLVMGKERKWNAR